MYFLCDRIIITIILFLKLITIFLNYKRIKIFSITIIYRLPHINDSNWNEKTQKSSRVLLLCSLYALSKQISYIIYNPAQYSTVVIYCSNDRYCAAVSIKKYASDTCKIMGTNTIFFF